MDSVLDTLLRSLLELVPYESAQILLLESDSRMFVAREAPHADTVKQAVKYPLTLAAVDFPVLQRVLVSQNGLMIPIPNRNRNGVLSGAPAHCAPGFAFR